MENIRIDDFTKYKFLSKVSFCPNGENACFVVHESDVDENKYNSNLWLYKCKENSYFKLTSFNSESNFIWLDNNENILFSSMRDEKILKQIESGEEITQFYKINIKGGEANKFFTINKTVTSIKQIDNNTYILTAIFNPNKKELNKLDTIEKAEELKRLKEEKDYEVIDEIPFWGNGQGFTNKIRNRLYVYHSDTEKLEAITDECINIEDYNFNKQNNSIIIIGSPFNDKMEINNHIYLYDLNKKELQQVTSDENFSYSYANILHGNTIICSGTDMNHYGINENHKFYTIDLKDKNKKCITPNFDKSHWNSVGSDCRFGGSPDKMIDGEYLYFITTEINSSYINRIDLNGHVEKITKYNGSVDSYSVKNHDILLIGMRNMKLQELYKLQNHNEIQITDFNEWIYTNKKVSFPEKINVETEPGVIIEGWILKPVDFDENKKYPAILDIHGGPKTVYGEVFYHEMQYWCNEGYAVFFCNPRGSDGRGNDFSDIRGKYGTIDYDDIMKFTDTVLEKYSFIDKDNIGVTGGSYGGFMTNWIIGHTDRFKAAASQRSISNWISKFCTTDIGYFFVDDQNCGTPWDNVDKLWNHSPLKYADKVKTPTLFIHSEQDYRCWLGEGLQMFTALKYHGVESRLCMFRGENHELSRGGKPKHRIRRLKEMTDWFNHYLKD